MNKNDLQNICMDFGIVTGNLKKNDLKLIIVDYQWNIFNEEEHSSDIYLQYINEIHVLVSPTLEWGKEGKIMITWGGRGFIKAFVQVCVV